VPRSRLNPQFNREILPDALGAAKIGYNHLPEWEGILCGNFYSLA
jgi:hypothetical protein